MQTNNQKETHFYCREAEKIPKVLHWAIITTKTGKEDGYDAGDPSTTYSYPEYEAFLVKDEWIAEIEKRTKSNLTSYSRFNFVAIEVNPAIINTTVEVQIG